MIRYTAEMDHDAKTLEKLVETQQRTFQFGRRAAHFLLSLLFILYGLFAGGGTALAYLALIAGCVMATGLRAGIRRQAGRIVQEINGEFPRSRYAFSEEGFAFHQGGEAIPYGRLIRLIEDEGYLYLYVSSQSAYMVDKSTVSGGGAAGLKAFLAGKTGLGWSRPNSLATFSLLTLLRQRREGGADGDQGPRLK